MVRSQVTVQSTTKERRLHKGMNKRSYESLGAILESAHQKTINATEKRITDMGSPNKISRVNVVFINFVTPPSPVKRG